MNEKKWFELEIRTKVIDCYYTEQSDETNDDGIKLC